MKWPWQEDLQEGIGKLTSWLNKFQSNALQISNIYGRPKKVRHQVYFDKQRWRNIRN